MKERPIVINGILKYGPARNSAGVYFSLEDFSLCCCISARFLRLDHGEFVGSREKVVDYLAMHVRQSAFNSIVIVGESIVPNPEKMEHRRVKIWPRDRFVNDFPADLVRRPVANTAFETRPREHTREAVLVVISADTPRPRRRLREGSPSEFRGEEEEGIFQHATFAEIR